MYHKSLITDKDCFIFQGDYFIENTTENHKGRGLIPTIVNGKLAMTELAMLMKEHFNQAALAMEMPQNLL